MGRRNNPLYGRVRNEPFATHQQELGYAAGMRSHDLYRVSRISVVRTSRCRILTQPRDRGRERHSATLFGTIRDIFLIMARARAAAQLYDDLRRRCDAELGHHGLERADLPRAAFDELTRKR